MLIDPLTADGWSFYETQAQAQAAKDGDKVDARYSSICHWDKYTAIQVAIYCDIKPTESTIEAMNEAEDTLPPYKYSLGGFFELEAHTANIRRQWAKRGGEVLTKLAIFTDKRTWIKAEDWA